MKVLYDCCEHCDGPDALPHGDARDQHEVSCPDGCNDVPPAGGEGR